MFELIFFFKEFCLANYYFIFIIILIFQITKKNQNIIDFKNYFYIIINLINESLVFLYFVIIIIIKAVTI
jgi:hypothetical protein